VLKKVFGALGLSKEGLKESLVKELDSDEEIMYMVEGNFDSDITEGQSRKYGILVATNQRVAFYDRFLTQSSFETFAYKSITAVGLHKSILVSTITLALSSRKVTMKVASGDVEDFVRYVNTKLR
jgi:hypothetical protein